MLVRLDLESRSGPRGDFAPYAELCGEAEFGLDPDLAANARVTDLGLAPRSSDGRVHCSADVRILRPVESGDGNRGVFLEVVNRGTSIFTRMLEPGPMGPATQISQGWLLQRGFTIVSCGWQHDVPRGNGRFGLSAPSALIDGQPVTGSLTIASDGAAPECSYPPLDPNEAGAVLVERDGPDGVSRIVPRDRWRFADAHHVSFDVDACKTYELTYTAVGASITGIGLAALRDLSAHLRLASAERRIDFVIAMGASQTGRLLRQMLYQGFCVDEDGRLAIDGILAIAAGARMTEANCRFGQPSAQGALSAAFPFTDAVQTDPLTGQTAGLVPTDGPQLKVIHLNTSSEYCSSAAITHISAALSHITADGRADAPVPSNVRIYHCAGTQHAASPLPLGPSDVPTGRGVYYPNTIDYKPFVRAAVDNLTAWVTQGRDPPPSCYPRFDDATLGPRDTVRDRMPTLPGPGLPPTRRSEPGLPSTPLTELGFPPRPRSAVDLVAAIDADGNELAGVRHPEVSVPLATYTGWNPRQAGVGGSSLLVRSTGATIPFAATRALREATDDPRPSIAERYADRGAYLDQVRSAALGLVAAGYLLEPDVVGIVETARLRYDAFSQLKSALP